MLKDHLRSAIEDKGTPAIVREPMLRPSALPYCPILYLNEVVEARTNPIQPVGFLDEVYFQVGTVMHDLWQAGIANSPEYGMNTFGDWKCQSCGKTREFRFRPKRLCKCGTFLPWKYVELALRYRNIPGHCDMLIRDPEDGWALLDLKTSSIKALNGPFLPYKKNVIQVQAYALMLWVRFKITLDKAILVYKSRDDPKQWKSYPVPWNVGIRKRTAAALDLACLGFSAARKALKDPSEANLQAVIEHRPCKRHGDFEASGMDAGFFREKCPLLATCASSRPGRVIPRLRARLRELENISAK